jgi:hypothetical protein
LVFPKGSLSSARALLREMAGGEDGTDAYLCRVALPTRGNWLRLYVVGSLGAKYLRKIGEQVAWRGTPYKLRHYSFSYLRHQHAVAQLLTALHCYCREYPAWQVGEMLNGYSLARNPPRATVVTDGQDTEVAAVPDAWVYVERAADGRGTALWFEIDNGSEYRKKYQQLLRARLALIKNGGYAEYFGYPFVRLCYIVLGETPYRQTRLHTLKRWTVETIEKEISEEHQQGWLEKILFMDLGLQDIYTIPLFEYPLWQPANDATKPVRLFDPLPPPQQGES